MSRIGEFWKKSSVALICAGGAAGLAMFVILVHRQGPVDSRDICARCGLQRFQRTWSVPATSFGIFWTTTLTNSLLSSSLQQHHLAHARGHHWLPMEKPMPQTQSTVASKLQGLLNGSGPSYLSSMDNPGWKLMPQFENSKVVGWVLALHKFGNSAVIDKWMRWLGDPSLSPHFLGVAVRYHLESQSFTNEQAFLTWLAGEEEKLVFGHPPAEK